MMMIILSYITWYQYKSSKFSTYRCHIWYDLFYDYRKLISKSELRNIIISLFYDIS